MAWEAAVNPEDCGHRGFINFAMGINKESTILASQSGMVLIVWRRNLSGLKVLKELSFFMTSPWNCFCMFKATSSNFSGWCRDSSNWVLNPISLGSILSNRPRKTEVRLYSQIVSYAKVGKALRTRTLSSSDGAVRYSKNATIYAKSRATFYGCKPKTTGPETGEGRGLAWKAPEDGQKANF